MVSIIKKGLMIHIILLASMIAEGATQGNTGPTSTGNLIVSVNKGDQVRITGLTDFTFGSLTSTPAKTSHDVCVYSTSGSYNVTASSVNASGLTLRMANSLATQFVSYILEWNNAASGTSGTALTQAVTSPAFSGANTLSSNCAGGVNARMFIQVDNTTFSAVPSGAYSDTLTLVLAPQ